MQRLGLLFSGLGLVLGACGDDGDGTGSETTGTGESSATEPSTSEDPSAGPGSSDGTTTSPATTDADTTAADSSTGTETGTDTMDFDCTMIPAAPFVAERILEDVPFAQSEDLGFDGLGHLAARGEGGAYLLVSADGTFEEITTDGRATYGLRFLANGDIIAAAYQVNDLLRITPTGEITDFAVDLGGVNGVFPDPAGGVWYTNFGEVGYIDAEGNDIAVISPASAANGIWFDDVRQIVFFTNYGNGGLRKADIVEGVAQPAVDLGTVPGAPDGITLDACGNLYANDQQGSRMYRLFLDESAEPIGEPEVLVEGGFPTNVANAQFGSGPGWEPDSLYALGVGGGLYRVAVGVPGATYVTVR